MSHFTYLHVNTHFSSKGGPASPDEWCRRAASLGYNAIGVADRAPMAAFPALAQAARSAGVFPVYGVELDLLLPPGDKSAPPGQAVLLFARDSTGMSNLARLSGLAHAGWPQRDEPLPWDTLAAHAEGLVLIILPSGESGGTASFVTAPAKKLSEWGSLLKGRFTDAVFVGLPHAGQPGDDERAEQVALAANNMGLPLVALPAAHYLNPEDFTSYQALKQARSRAGWPAPASPEADGGSVQGTAHDFMRSPDQAAALFQPWPQALENTNRIADMCRLGGDIWANLLTQDPTRDGQSLEALREIAQNQLLRIIGAEQLPEEVSQRLEAELVLVEQSGRARAWLALSHMTNAKSAAATAQSRVVGAPLGTVDGSLLAYALGLTPLDPMPYPQPPSLALATKDRDLSMLLPGIEVPASRRDEILAALAKEFGPSRVAHAACAVHSTPIVALQAAAAVLNTPSDTLQELAAPVVERGWSALEVPEGSDASLPSQHDTIHIARALRGAPIYFKPDLDTLVLLPPQTDSSPPTLPLLRLQGQQLGSWVPWSEDTLCSCAPAALTVQPSTALSTLDMALSLAANYPSPNRVSAEVDLSAFPQLGEEAAGLIRKGQIVGVPYLSSKVVKGWEGEIGAQTMSLLVARSLMERPTHNAQPPADLDAWVSVTEETGGVLIYKDQLAAIAQRAAGMSPADEAILRRALLNSYGDEGREIRHQFAEGCRAAGIAEEQVNALWDALEASAPHLISRQVAAAWARAAMWGVEIKATHPAALLAAALAVSWEGSHTGIAPLVEEARRLGISILPPDINLSLAMPCLEREGTGWAIRWGLSLLPGWGVDSAQRLVSARQGQGFGSLRDLVSAAATGGLSVAHVETLIRSGACDRLGNSPRSRSRLLELLPSVIEWAESSSHNSPTNTQLDLFAMSQPSEPPVEDERDGASSTPRWRSAQRAWEENNLGIAFTSAPEMDLLRRALDNCGDLRARLLTTTQIRASLLGQSVYLIGLLCSIEIHAPSQTSQNGSKPQPVDAPLAVGWLEDLDGSIELVAFPPSYKRHIDQWTEGNLVIVTGRVSQHADGEIYLLCQHIAPYFAEADEGEISLKIKASRKAAAASAPTESVEPQFPVVAKTALTQPHRAAPEPDRAVIAVAEPAEATAIAQPTYKLIVTLPGSEDDHADIDTMITLNRLLEQHPGDDVVVLRIPYLPEIGAVTTAQLPRRVRYSQNLEARIRNLLGYDALATIKLVS
jgi:DNA polymerase-3 subunit alpha